MYSFPAERTFLTHEFLFLSFLQIYCLLIGAVGFVHGAGLQSNVKGTISNELIHVSDWYLTLLSAAAAATTGTTTGSSSGSSSSSSSASSSSSSTETTSALLLELQLKPNERPFIDGDGVSNWATIATGTSPSARTEILIAAQAEGSKLQAQALRSGETWETKRKRNYTVAPVLLFPSLEIYKRIIYISYFMEHVTLTPVICFFLFLSFFLSFMHFRRLEATSSSTTFVQHAWYVKTFQSFCFCAPTIQIYLYTCQSYT